MSVVKVKMAVYYYFLPFLVRPTFHHDPSVPKHRYILHKTFISSRALSSCTIDLDSCFIPEEVRCTKKLARVMLQVLLVSVCHCTGTNSLRTYLYNTTFSHN